MATSKDEKTLDVTKEERELSDSDEESEILPKTERQGPGGKVLTFNHTDSVGLSRSTQILEGQSPAYFIAISQFAAQFTRKKPDLTLHRGGEDGAVVATSYWSWPRTFKCGIGGGSDDASTEWTEMKRSGFFGGRVFAFEWKGATYRLARAKSEDTDGIQAGKLGHILGKHFKVVDDKSGDLLALYTAAVGGKQSGTMSFKPGLPEDLEILFVLGVASWREGMRRSRQYSYGGAGGA